MGLFKPDLYRSFALGFAAGALLVLGTMGFDAMGSLTNSVAPPASAAPAQ